MATPSASRSGASSSSSGQDTARTDKDIVRYGSGDLVGNILRATSAARPMKSSSGIKLALDKHEKRSHVASACVHAASENINKGQGAGDEDTLPRGVAESALLQSMHKEMVTMQQISFINMQEALTASCANMTKSMTETLAKQFGVWLERGESR